MKIDCLLTYAFKSDEKVNSQRKIKGNKVYKIALIAGLFLLTGHALAAYTEVKGSSRIDGIPMVRLMSGENFDARSTQISNCLIENLMSIPGAVMEQTVSSASTGSSD